MDTTAEAPKLNSFLDYKQLILTMVTDLERLHDYAEELGLTRSRDLIGEVSGRLKQDCFTVAVVGEFKRGKSTFINALLGEEILPTDVLPTTATLNRVVYGVEKGVLVRFKDGSEERISIDQLPDYVTKLTGTAETMAAAVQEAVVYYPVLYCQNNVEIVDTPGLNDDATMTTVTLSVLPRVDAAILVIMAQSPFSEYERDFLENRLLTSDLGRVIFVVTAIDRFNRPEDAERVVQSIRERIKRFVMQRAADQFGQDSEEYKVYLRKIGEPKVFGLAALPALEAKASGDMTRLRTSKFPDFERALERFLTQERGAIVLQVPVNRLLGSSTEILEAIKVREGALSMQLGEFQSAHDQAVRDLGSVRKKKNEELGRVDQAREQVKAEIQPIIRDMEEELKSAAAKVIDTAQITPADLEKHNQEAFRKRLGKQVETAVVKASNQVTERIQDDVTRALALEGERLQGVAHQMEQTVRSIELKFTDSRRGSERGGGGVETALAVAGVVTGFTGIWSGYREAGVKGAVVGGLVGGLTGVAGLTAVLVGAAALGVAAVPLLPLTVGAMVLSYLTGGKVTRMVWSGERIDRFRAQYKSEVQEAISQQYCQMHVAHTIDDQITKLFEDMKRQLNQELEALIDTAETTLVNVRAKRERGETLNEGERKELEEMRMETQRIRGNAQRLANQLVQVMSV